MKITVKSYFKNKANSTPWDQNQKKTLTTDFYSHYSIISLEQKKALATSKPGQDSIRLPLESRGLGKEIMSAILADGQAMRKRVRSKAHGRRDEGTLAEDRGRSGAEYGTSFARPGTCLIAR